MSQRIRLRRQKVGEVKIIVLDETFQFNVVTGNGTSSLYNKLKNMNRNDRVTLYFKIRKQKKLGICSFSYSCGNCPYKKDNKCTYKEKEFR
jgi:hypothetical protein